MHRREFLKGCVGATAAVCAGGVPRVAWGAEPAIDRWTRTVCDLCGLCEPVFLGAAEERLAAVKGIPASTIGFGRLCPRARALHVASDRNRALRPMVRRDPASKGTAGGLTPVSWDEALAFANDGIDRLESHRLAFLSSDGETDETYHLLGRMARGVFGTDHVDTPAGCDALHAYDACRDVFGIPGNPASLEDVDAADLILLIGGDLSESHPSLFYRVLDSRRAARSRVILVDPRKTLAASVADLHIRPRPGRELAVVNAMAARLARASGPAAGGSGDLLPGEDTWRAWLGGRVSAETPRCRKPLASPSSPPRRALLRAADDLAAAGVDASLIERAAGAWRDARAVVTIVGPTALSGPAGGPLATQCAQVHRVTGQWGAVGKGILFLPKGANACGAAAQGIAPGRLPAGRSLASATDREATAAVWGVAPEALPDAAGRPALEWPAAIRAGELGAMVVLRANPAAEFPAASRWRDGLTSSFVVYAATHTPTETEAFADVVLPLALVSGESDGTIMALDRRCQLLERVTAPPGEARTAARILIDLARPRPGAAERDRYDAGPHVAWDEWRRLAAGTPFDASGITIGRLRESLGVKWPCPGASDPGLERAVPDGVLESRTSETGEPLPPPPLATPAPLSATPLPDGLPVAGAERPLLLFGGPIREHFRSRVRTGLVPELHYDAPVARIEMHPADGSALGIKGGDWVTLESETGELTARVWLTDRSPRGALYVPEHYGFLSDAQGGTDTLKEPEGLLHLVTGDEIVHGTGAPAGLVAAVSARLARRRDMRRRGLRS